MDWLPYLMAMAVAAATLWWGLPTLYVDLLRRSLRARARDQRRVHLTFDDGPGASLTPRVLDELDAMGAVGTFFVLGRKAEQMGDLVREAAARGHIIGSHGYGHVNYWFCSPRRAIADVRQGWQVLRDVLGVEASRLPYRPPFGKLNLAALLYLRQHRTPIWMWTIDSRDTSPDGIDLEAHRRELVERGGGVVLMHDHDRSQGDRADALLRLVRNAEPTHGEADWVLGPVTIDARESVATQAALAPLRAPEPAAPTATHEEAPVGAR